MERTGAFLESTCIFGDDDAYGSAFWDLVSCCVSDAKVNAWRETVERGSLTQRYYNIITTSPNAHVYWDTGLYALKHIEISDDQKTMKVQFFWLPDAGRPEEYMTTPPDMPGNLATSERRRVKLYDCKTGEVIQPTAYRARTTISDCNYLLSIPTRYILEL